MSFVHLSLLTLGGLLAAVPIVLHLAMKPKPKHQMFPALRFLRQRQATNQRRLRLRQFALLLLRCLIVLLLALALARPSVQSAQLGNWLVAGLLGLLLIVVGWLTAVAAASRRSWALLAVLAILGIGLVAGLVNTALGLMRDQAPTLLGDRRAAVAAVLLMDTSPRMGYEYNNQSRLQRAQQIGQWLLLQFPADSEVAIVDSSSASTSFSVDLGAATATLDALETTYLPQSLERQVEDALRVLKESSKQRKELYILSDMTRASWETMGSDELQTSLQEASDVTIQVIDVGVEQPTNTSVSDLQLSQSSLTPGSPLEIRTRVSQTGAAQSTTVQLFMESPDESPPLLVDGQLQTPPVTVRGRQSVNLPENGDEFTAFSLASLPFGTHNGYLELDGTDGLECDNRLDFTVHVRPPWSILVLTSPESEPYFVTERLAPQEFRASGRAKFNCSVVPITQLSEQRLADYDAVGLLDPPPLDDSQWRQIENYARRGGGVALFLGRQARSATEFNTPSALRVLPAPLDRRWRDQAGISLAPRDYDQPLLSVLRDIQTTVPWDAMPVFQHWVVGALQSESRTLVPFSNNKPAVLERTMENGRVIMLTTPVSDADVRGRSPWNLLPTSLDSWPFLILLDRIFLTLVQSDDAPLNYSVGQPAQLPVETQTAERFSLFTPRGTWLELTSSKGKLIVPFTEVPGTYRLGGDPVSSLPRGFSVSLPAAATQLGRITREQLNDALGDGRYQLARTEDEIVREIDQSRMGKEFYPFLLPLLVVILALEYVVANRFYPEAN